MKIIIGAGEKSIDGWISTEQNQLDVLCKDDFEHILDGKIGFEAMLAEHVFEHIDRDRLPDAFWNCYLYLSVGGHLRIAVPDGFHIDPQYIEYVKPGGTGAGADSHQSLFNYRSLSRYLREAGFAVKLLEWWDETGQFHCKPWNEADGYIERCLASDPRNKDGKPHYTSLIMDAYKEIDTMRPHLVNAFEFVENNDPHRVSPFNRKKTTTFYELARLAPADGVIVELGSFHGVGTAALWWGTRDGHRCKVISVDAYTDMHGWAGESYGPKDQEIWTKNVAEAKIYPQLYRGDSHEMAQRWTQPISLLLHDLGSKNRMPEDVLDWERHIILGGFIALRDIDDYSMGTEKAIRNLMSTGRWDKRRNWEAFITSMERVR